MTLRLKNANFGGQSLIEVVVSIGIAVILAISLITTSLITQKSSRSARNNSQATKLVQQTLEQWRVYRDRYGFAALPNVPPPTPAWYCLNTPNSDPSSWAWDNTSCTTTQTISLDNSNFTRKIEVLNQGVSNEKRLITVTVSWDESGQTRSVKSQTFLSLWQDFP